MYLTKHAEKRMGQRGFSDLTLKIIEQNGISLPCPGGGTKIVFGKKEYQKTVQDIKRLLQALDKAKGGTIVTIDDLILTMYKQCTSKLRTG